MSKSVKLPLIGIACGVFALVMTLAVPHFTVSLAHAQDGSALVDAGTPDAGSASAPSPAPLPSDSLANPVDDPVEAYSDLKAAKKQGWAFAVLAGLCMAAAALGRAAMKWPTWPVLSWINEHKKVLLITAGVGVTATAAFNALALGGSWFAIIGAAGGALLAFISTAPSEAKA